MTTFAPGTMTPKSVPDTLNVAGQEIKGFSALPPEKAMILRMRMIEAANDCGCRWATVYGGIALNVYLVLSILVPYLRGQPTTFSWWWAGGVMLGGFLLGKAFGTYRAKRALLDAIEEFQRQLAARK